MLFQHFFQLSAAVFPECGLISMCAVSPGSDIDAVCVGPGFVQRHHFFSSFCRKLAANKEVTDMLAFEKTVVPVVKLTYKGEKDSVPEAVDLMDDGLVRGLDPRCVRSLNGYRDSVQILRCVPNVYVFRTVLRIIKVWAKKRQIYSNRLGFLGGISWAILVARVCQLYPNATVAALVTHFFRLYSTWDWKNPVRLRNENREFPSWDSQAPWSDRFPLMPIMTPAFPQQNSTFNMAKSNMAIISQEFVRGMKALFCSVVESRVESDDEADQTPVTLLLPNLQGCDSWKPEMCFVLKLFLSPPQAGASLRASTAEELSGPDSSRRRTSGRSTSTY
uniref:polynucleotide adenylyltransferase n=1 Tax=Salarias fasciatus TaxID=181472 RepID=A0A672HRA8_SALFA